LFEFLGVCEEFVEALGEEGLCHGWGRGERGEERGGDGARGGEGREVGRGEGEDVAGGVEDLVEGAEGGGHDLGFVAVGFKVGID
jgi:hypothetical protein